MKKADFLVIGGGIVGLCAAQELKRRFPDQSVTLIEKESELGLHASGRNSGVLHAGFYYTADSLKAKFTRDGNRAWRAFCETRGLRVNECGKLVVAHDESELAGLDELLQRGLRNDVPVEMISAQDAKEIEPRVKTFERALWSPITATVAPGEVVGRVAQETREMGVEILTDSPFVKRQGKTVHTRTHTIEAGYVLNCAGLHADWIAKQYGFAKDLEIVPFKGLYLYSDEPVGAVRTNIYPVPNLKNPFLGVHYTLTIDGKAKIGPTAIPAFWRENYKGMEGFDGGDFLRILAREAGLFLKAGFDFRSLAIEEVKKHRRSHMVALAQRLMEGVKLSDYTKWGKPGIRAQLMDVRTSKLIMDFHTEGDSHSLHVLNAVSPGFTCAIPFASFIVDRICESAVSESAALRPETNRAQATSLANQ